MTIHVIDASKTKQNQVGALLTDGYARPLDENDLFELPPYMRSRFLTDRLEARFEQYHKEGYKYPLAWAMIYANLRSVSQECKRGLPSPAALPAAREKEIFEIRQACRRWT